MNLEKLKIKFKNSKKGKRLYGLGKAIWYLFSNLVMDFFSIIFRLVPIKQNKIVIVNYNGKGYGDNPKYISEQLLKNDIEVDIVWLVKKNILRSSEFPKNIRLVKNESLRAIFELATSKIWIDNTIKRFKTRKRTGQFYIQTWHAGLGLKKVGLDARNIDQTYLKLTEEDTKITDFVISNSQYRSNSYRNSFGYTCSILEYGLPRNDILVQQPENVKQKLKKELGIQGKKVALYAPTFRKDSTVELFNMDISKLKETLEATFGSEWVVLLRLHPYISSFSEDVIIKDFVKDLTNYNDVSELLLVSDLLVSDYSSLMFDFAIQRKPVFIYAPDFDSYHKKEGLNFSEMELPFTIAKHNDMLMKQVENYNEKVYLESLEIFFQKNGLNETGRSTEQVTRQIYGLIK